MMQYIAICIVDFRVAFSKLYHCCKVRLEPTRSRAFFQESPLGFTMIHPGSSDDSTAIGMDTEALHSLGHLKIDSLTHLDRFTQLLHLEITSLTHLEHDVTTLGSDRAKALR